MKLEIDAMTDIELSAKEYFESIKKLKFGFLRAHSLAPNEYLKRHPDIFWYQGDQIFHYTDLNGLIGIVQNRGFWLSDARYLNDAEEIQNGAKLATALLEKIINKNKNGQFKKILEGVRENLENTSPTGLYICSFSATPDTLEQWRAYKISTFSVSTTL
jgi:hypothetical protein